MGTPLEMALGGQQRGLVDCGWCGCCGDLGHHSMMVQVDMRMWGPNSKTKLTVSYFKIVFSVVTGHFLYLVL